MSIMEKPINILVVDDHEAIGAGLVKLGEFSEKLNFVGTCKSKDELECFLRKQAPDIIIMDISLGKQDGIEITKEIRKKFPDIKIVIYSIDRHAGAVIRAIRSGASGFFSKSSDTLFFLQALENLQRSKFVTSQDISDKINDNYFEIMNEADVVFDEIDSEIIAKVCEGKCLKEIGAELKLSEKTISNHKTNILKKLELKSDADLIKYAIKNGIISLE